MDDAAEIAEGIAELMHDAASARADARQPSPEAAAAQSQAWGAPRQSAPLLVPSPAPASAAEYVPLSRSLPVPPLSSGDSGYASFGPISCGEQTTIDADCNPYGD